MSSEKSTSREEEVVNVDVGQSSKMTEQGYYGQALRKGQVRQPPPGAPRIVNLLL